MSEVSYVLIVPGKVHIRHPSIEEATNAAKEYIQDNPEKFLMVSIHEISNNKEKKGRVIFHAGGQFHVVELTMS